MSNFLNKYFGFDELVFENRNREYGAYVIRKYYNKSIVSGLIISIVLCSSAILIPFFISSTRIHNPGYGSGSRFVELQVEHFEPPKEEPALSQISVPPPPPQPDLKYVIPIIVDTVPSVDKMQITEVNETKSENNIIIGRESDLAYGEGDDIFSGDNALVETKPSFKGGDIEKFREWVARNTNYPITALKNGIYGTVVLTFIIEKDGSVTNVKLLKGVDKIIDEEALRTIKSSPKWSPGRSNGRPIRFRYLIPLAFKPF